MTTCVLKRKYEDADEKEDNGDESTLQSKPKRYTLYPIQEDEVSTFCSLFLFFLSVID